MQIGGDMIGADVTNGREEKKSRMKAYCHEKKKLRPLNNRTLPDIYERINICPLSPPLLLLLSC